jgi:hypothetical protein
VLTLMTLIAAVEGFPASYDSGVSALDNRFDGSVSPSVSDGLDTYPLHGVLEAAWPTSAQGPEVVEVEYCSRNFEPMTPAELVACKPSLRRSSCPDVTPVLVEFSGASDEDGVNESSFAYQRYDAYVMLGEIVVKAAKFGYELNVTPLL